MTELCQKPTGQVLYAKVEICGRDSFLDDGEMFFALVIGRHDNAADAFRRYASGVVADEKLVPGCVCAGSSGADQFVAVGILFITAILGVNAGSPHLRKCDSQYKY